MKRLISALAILLGGPWSASAVSTVVCRVRVTDTLFNGQKLSKIFLPKEIRDEAACRKRMLDHCDVYNPSTVDDRSVAFSYGDADAPPKWQTLSCKKAKAAR